MMKNLDIVQQRLSNQHLAGNPLKTAADVVAWLGAVQAQDYANTKWAVGHSLVIDGRMAGTWRRDFQKDTVTITLKRFTPLSETQEGAVHIAAERYGNFMGLTVLLKQA